jgi:hypothetical protein
MLPIDRITFERRKDTAMPTEMVVGSVVLSASVLDWIFPQHTSGVQVVDLKREVQEARQP